MQILLLNTQMEAAGAQKAMLVLARGLQACGHKVQVVTMYDKADYVTRFSQYYGVDIVDLHMKRPDQRNFLLKIVDVVAGLWRLYRLLRQAHFDVVQTFSHYSNIIGPVFAWLAGVPIRVSSQRMSLKGAPGWLLFLDRVIANSFFVDKMISVSEGTRRFSILAQKIHPEKIITIHNSIDLDRFDSGIVTEEDLFGLRHELGIPVDVQVVTTVARLHPQKGYEFLIDAIAVIKDDFPDVRFLFVGEGELREELVAKVARMGLETWICFLGMRQDIPKLLALSDVFVLPSLWEGLPNSVLEAMAMETPVIATNVDGCPEVIRSEDTGILIPPKNVDALVEAICKLLRNSDLRQAMALAAQKWVVAQFSEKKNISSFEQLYEDLIATKV